LEKEENSWEMPKIPRRVIERLLKEPGKVCQRKFKIPCTYFLIRYSQVHIPGLGAEERGQSEAIARNLLEFTSVEVPLISIRNWRGWKWWSLSYRGCR